MAFTYPYALLALLLLPYFLWLGRPRGAWARTRAITALVLRALIVILLVFAFRARGFANRAVSGAQA